MPWAESSLSLRAIAGINLVLRLILVGFVLYTGHWIGSDSDQYIRGANWISQGAWGGESGRTPLYYWFLSLLSGSISFPGSAAQMAAPLFIQTILVWGAGLLLMRRTQNRLLLLFWFFDPVLMAYSNLIMSDAVFAASMLLLALGMKDVLKSATTKHLTLFGLYLGLVLLGRPIGMLVAGCSMVVLFVLIIQKKLKPFAFGLCMLVLASVIAPRLYWNHTQNRFWGLAKQGAAWQGSVAGVIENEGSGLDYIQSEEKWFRDHPIGDQKYVYHFLFTHLGSWIRLSLKGAARILVGHVNVEWSQVLTGQAPIGPGWFKVRESRAGDQVQGVSLVLWTFGVLFTLVYCCVVYFKTFKIWISQKPFSIYSLWAIACIFLLAAAPQVWGDARFRAALWPLVLTLWLK